MGQSLVGELPSNAISRKDLCEQDAAKRRGKNRHYRLLVLLLVITVSVLPFLPSLRYGFVYDDELQIISNRAIQEGGFVRSYFVTPIGGFYDLAASRPYYRPLFMLWLRLNYAIFGQHAFGWHLTSLGAHLGATMLVFFLMRHHFENPRSAVAGAIIFGLHPVHIESVAWISGVTDPLVVIGMLGSLLLWLKSRESPSIHVRSASLLCYASALLTKEIAVILPVFIFIYVLSGVAHNASASRKGISTIWAAILQVLPFVAVTALYLAARYFVVIGLHAESSWLSLHDALLTVPSLVIFYLRHLVWPANLSVFYDFEIVANAKSASFWLPIIFLTGLSLAGWLWWRKQRKGAIPALFAWLFLPLLPMLNIALLSPDDFAHDRYLYLSSVGLSVTIALLLESLAHEDEHNWRATGATAVAALLIAPLGIATVMQSRPWRDNFALYRHAVERSPKNALALNNLAVLYARRGYFQEAGELFRGALARFPRYWNANFNYGYMNYETKNLALAESFLLRAINIDPHTSDQHFFLGMIYLREHRPGEAEPRFREAIARKPDGLGYHLALGLVLQQDGNRKAAKEEFLKELAYHPENGSSRSQLAAMEAELGARK